MHTAEVNVGGQPLTIETGKLAKQASGSVVVRYGDTMVLVTACYAAWEREGLDFLPLTVDYRENTYASGRIPGGFFKREGKPPEKEVLTSRVIDRPLRPLFPDTWRRETQVVAFVISADTDNDSDVLALTGASAALALSAIPFQTTIAAVRVGLIDGELIINPTYTQRREGRLDLVIAGSKDALVMVEAGAQIVSEEDMIRALDAGHAAIRDIIVEIDKLAATAGKAKLEVTAKSVDAATAADVEAALLGPLADAMRLKDKLESYAAIDKVIDDYLATIPEDETTRRADSKSAFKALKEKVLRDEILEQGIAGWCSRDGATGAEVPGGKMPVVPQRAVSHGGYWLEVLCHEEYDRDPVAIVDGNFLHEEGGGIPIDVLQFDAWRCICKCLEDGTLADAVPAPDPRDHEDRHAPGEHGKQSFLVGAELDL